MNTRFGATNFGTIDAAWTSTLRASETLVVNSPPGPDLKLTKTASPADVTSGSDVNFDLKVDNTGAASGAFTVTDTIPAGFTVKTLPTGCTQSGSTVTCANIGLATSGP
ncbi:hypothetical protein [Granulicoccus sp. GXG6511]|uniref:hypothetical protein n=1 Tax=Granulicoccus sp. GXG6511 TaxID=3381351 RepID=UPI003D7C9553